MLYSQKMIFNPFVNKLIRLVLIFIYNYFESEKIINTVKSLSLKVPCVGVFNFTVNSRHNIKLVSDKEDGVIQLLFWPWLAEESETLVIYNKLVKSSDVIFDIGAYNGLYSILAATINPDANIYAFEPTPSTFNILKRNVLVNNLENIDISNMALSNIQGRAQFYLPMDSTLPSDASLLKGFRPDSKVVDVRVETIDDFVQKNDIGKIDLIKLDVEAVEPLVLQGGLMQIEIHRPIIICEVLYNRTEKELENFFSKLSYAYYLITNKGLVVSENIIGDKTYEFRNWIFVPQEKIYMIQTLISNK